jgi:hypothetical protein
MLYFLYFSFTTQLNVVHTLAFPLLLLTIILLPSSILLPEVTKEVRKNMKNCSLPKQEKLPLPTNWARGWMTRVHFVAGPDFSVPQCTVWPQVTPSTLSKDTWTLSSRVRGIKQTACIHLLP